MIRTFCLALLLAVSWPVLAEVESVRFEGLKFPLSPAWSNLTIIGSGFGLKTDSVERPTGPGTFSAMVLNADEYTITLEDGSQVSLVTMLIEHLRGETAGAETDSAKRAAIYDSFQNTTRVNHETLSVYVEDEAYLPDTFKAYIIRENRDPIEISASMEKDDFENYLKSVQPVSKP